MTVHAEILPAAGSDGSWLDDAANGLKQSPVYVDEDVAGVSQLQETLAQQVPKDHSIAVVVLPKEALLESGGTSTYLLDTLFQGSDYGTLVVAIGGDLQADSHTIGRDKAMQIANESESAADGNVQSALVETVQHIEAAEPATGGTNGGAADPVIAWLLPVGIVVAVVAAGVATTFAVLRRRRRGRTGGAAPIPASIAERLNRLRALQQGYARLGAAGNVTAAQTAAGIDALAGTVAQLFPRLDAKAAADQRSLAEVEYTDKLGRLVAALDRDYLLDLLQNPRLWEAPEERIREVQDALAAVSQQALDNVKQVNARKALHFQVSLDSLVGRDELRDWEREFKRNSGE
jgi:hypothetical protein